MSILGSKLTGSSGVGSGGARSAGAYSNSSVGSNSTMTAASSTGPIPGMNAVSTGTGDILSGKLTLAAIEVLLLGLVGFYIWTHKIQGGG